MDFNETSGNAVGYGETHVDGPGEHIAAMDAAAMPRRYEPALAGTPSGSGELSAVQGLAPVRPRRVRAARSRRHHMPPWPVVAPALAGSVAVVIATTVALLSSSDVSTTVIPTTAVAVGAWCAALQYMYWGGMLGPLTLGTAIASVVAGAIGLAGASVAVMLLPGMDVVHRTELLIVGGGVAIGAALYDILRRRFGPRRRVLIVGADGGGADLIDELRSREDLPLECVGMVDDKAHPLTVLGCLDDLPTVVERERPDVIVLAGVDDRARAIQRIFEVSRFRFRLVELSHFYEDAFGRLPLHNLTPAWFMGLLHLHRRPYSRASKRAFDLVVTAIAIVPVMLLLPLVALLVRCSGPGAILFRQVRLGEGGNLFEIYKFRTMVVDAERQGVAVWASAADPRITPVGRFLRRTRLDELPQLWNVLRGDMSIVGPRPERPEFLELLAQEVPFWERRHLVKPGITGWAQIRCGYTDDSLGAAEKLSHDLYYLKHRSLLLDLAIAAKTASILVRGTGAH